MSLPNSSSQDAISEDKNSDCLRAGEAVVNLLNQDIKPSDIMTKKAFENAINISATEYAQSVLKLKEVQLKFSEMFLQYDMIASPTMPTTAFDVGNPPQEINGQKVHPSWGFCLYSYPVNLAGTPAVNIPTGFDNKGLPIGLHIFAPWEQEK